MTNEEWVKLEEYSVEVSNLGQVRTPGIKINSNGKEFVLSRGRILKPYLKSHGIYKVGIAETQIPIGFLVALAFVENDNPKEKTYIDYLDGNKLNNCSSNLIWTTFEEHQAFKNILRGKTHASSKAIMQLTKLGREVARYESIREAARITGFFPQNIGAAANGKLKTYKGFRWRFIYEEGE